MIIRKNAEPKELTEKTITNPFGGHVPFVGENCIKQSYIFKNMNVKWIDAGVCINCIEKPCEYFKAWKESLK